MSSETSEQNSTEASNPTEREDDKENRNSIPSGHLFSIIGGLYVTQYYLISIKNYPTLEVQLSFLYGLIGYFCLFVIFSELDKRWDFTSFF